MTASTSPTTPILAAPRLTRAFADAFEHRLALPWEAAAFPDPHVVVVSEDHARELGLDPDWLASEDGASFLTGRALPEGARPVAQAYAGHQFGGYSPRLGDGRALLLGELDTPAGRCDLHLKGSGRTPFARGGDGLAALGPMLREFVISEAMHALRIRTTRSLAVVSTGRDVRREEILPGALLARTASSHLRVGSFQFAAATGDLQLLRDLADHAIERHYPAALDRENPYLALLEAVTAAQAELVASWMLVGFVHGVMNTDNTTISGETIDYGPCAFLDRFDPQTVFSSIDEAGRYAYGNQPLVLQWNLARLAESLLPLIDDEEDRAVELALEAVHRFLPAYEHAFLAGMRGKLGLPADVDEDVLAPLVHDLLDLLEQSRVDYTSFLRRLSGAVGGNPEPARSMVLDLAGIDAWLDRWLELSPDAEVMDRVNPVYIPRNHLVEEALTAATAGDLAPFERLLEVVRAPFTEREGLERYAEPDPQARPYRTFCGT